jgi:hypothetical protein
MEEPGREVGERKLTIGAGQHFLARGLIFSREPDPGSGDNRSTWISDYTLDDSRQWLTLGLITGRSCRPVFIAGQRRYLRSLPQAGCRTERINARTITQT